MNVNPSTAVGVAISATVRAVLFALAAVNVVDWDESAQIAVAFAISSIVDLLLVLGVLKLRLRQVEPAPAPKDE